MDDDRPTIFIGSSSEAKPLVAELAERLEATMSVKALPWYEAFEVGFAALEDLARRLDEVDYAAFIMRPDDMVRIRGRVQNVTRDNVVFELGLFMGKLDRNRTFAVVADGVEMPTDFKGVTHIKMPQKKRDAEPFDPDRPESWDDSQADLDEPAGKILDNVRRYGPVRRIPHNVHVVERGSAGRSAYDTISAALAVAQPGDVILVGSGMYSEALVIDKPVEIIGIGVLEERQEAVIRSSAGSAVTYRAAGAGRISNLTIEAGGDDRCAAVDVAEGRIRIAGCHIRSLGPIEACIRVRGDGFAHIIANTIEDGHGVGVLICERGNAQVTDNSILRHAHSCVEVRDTTRPMILGNRISNGRSGGVLIHEGSLAVVERNDIFENRDAGIAVYSDGAPTIKGNRIHDGFAAGVWVGDKGQATISENDVYANRGTGLEIQAGGDPLIVNNRIYNGAGGGIVLHPGALGRIEQNEIRGNQRAGVALLSGSQPETFSGNRIVDGRAEGIYCEIDIARNENVVERNQPDWRAGNTVGDAPGGTLRYAE
jgi:parallel beta-helix repeat protein